MQSRPTNPNTPICKLFSHTSQEIQLQQNNLTILGVSRGGGQSQRGQRPHKASVTIVRHEFDPIGS